MKNLVPILFIILIIASFLPLVEGTQGNHTFYISSLTIKFDKTDAEFIVTYDIDMIPKMYILIMGGKSIESRINGFFSNLDYNVIKMDQKKSILHVKNISRFEKGYYLHDSISFGTKIDIMTIYTPGDKRPTEYTGINATPNIFYRE